MRKVCRKCREHKLKSAFSKDLSRKDKLRPYCKSCCSVYGRQWRARKSGEIRQYNRKYYKNNKEGYKKRQQLFRESSTEKYLLGLARRRARRSGIKFSLEVSDIIIPKTCPVFEIDLQLNRGKRGPNSPSLDRVDNTKGYVPGNVIVISVRANELKKDATIEEILLLAKFYKGYKK